MSSLKIHRLYGFFMRRFRPRRARQIARRFPLLSNPEARVLDVGGGAYPWELLNPAARITILNVNRPQSIPDRCKWEFVVGDGTRLAYPDGSFDLVFSNSVIEHVGDGEAQRRFATEMLRVGKQIYCQTPNRWFPVEPHLITVFVHWLPHAMQRRVVRFGSLWGLVVKPTQHEIDDFLATTRLLSRAEVAALFPGCIVRAERVLGLTKSFIVETSERVP